MQSLIEGYKKNRKLHHCYLILGEVVQNRKAVLNFCERELEVPVRGNPDLAIIEAETLGIDEVRSLIERQSRRSANQGKKIFLIISQFFTREAQNALLKVLEEPTTDTHFFILTGSTNGLLPTLLSRVFLVISEAEISLTEAKKFVKMPLNQRLEFAKNLSAGGEKQKIIELVQSLQILTYQTGVKKNATVLGEMEKMSNYLYDRAASSKMILEHLALTLPEAK